MGHVPIIGLEEDFLVDVFGRHGVFVLGFHVKHDVELLLSASIRRVDVLVLVEIWLGITWHWAPP